ncbi:MAG: hypothetical protein ABIG44_05520 [Planctomycetota bacterium]
MKTYNAMQIAMTILTVLLGTTALPAQSPFATTVIDFTPAPGQFVNDNLYNDPAIALGRPYGGGFTDSGMSSLVSLGGFGGSITLGFDHTVLDDPANPFGLDAIVYGNAIWVGANPNRRWAECGHIEISQDVNSNSLADDPWYLIPGSHIGQIGMPADQLEIQVWDDNIADPTWPPEDEYWIPPGNSGTWSTSAFRLPPEVFETVIVENPNGPDATEEGIFGYADYTPTLKLGDLDGDNIVDDPDMLPEEFYPRPDDPLAVGLTLTCGGGDAFDIAWAIDPITAEPANLAGFDFIRITTAVNLVILMPPPPLNELSTEIDAVVDVAEGSLGDMENDGDIDLDDLDAFMNCLTWPGEPLPSGRCRVMDFDLDGDLDLNDLAYFQASFTGS